MKQREKNTTHPESAARVVAPYSISKVRLRYSHELTNGWSFKSTLDMAQYQAKFLPKERGYMISQGIAYRGKGRVTGDAYLAWFDADTYNARLYSYERNLLSTFHMPSFYGKGGRVALSTKCQVTERLALSVKAGYTRYTNRNTIGSGTQQIDGNSRTDIFTYLVWRI